MGHLEAVYEVTGLAMRYAAMTPQGAAGAAERGMGVPEGCLPGVAEGGPQGDRGRRCSTAPACLYVAGSL